jgi:hypothetical protein
LKQKRREREEKKEGEKRAFIEWSQWVPEGGGRQSKAGG